MLESDWRKADSSVKAEVSSICFAKEYFVF